MRWAAVASVAVGWALAACHGQPSRVAETAPSEPIAIERGIHGHVLVPLTTGGHPGMFLLDTGASADLVTPSFARMLGLTPKGATQSLGAGGSAGAVAVVSLPEIQVGDERFAAHDVAVQEFDPEEPRISGVLGRTFLEQRDAQVDFARGQLRLYPRGSTRSRADLGPPGFAHVPFTEVSGIVSVTARLDGGDPVPAILDFGATQSIASRAAAAMAGVATSLQDAGSVAVGADGRNIPVGMQAFRSLAVGDVVVQAPTLAVADLPVFEQLGLKGPALLVGLDFLDRRTVVIDFADHEIALSRRP
jgi:predicted aspartyl protease